MVKEQNSLWHHGRLCPVLAILCISPFWSYGKEPTDIHKQCEVLIRETPLSKEKHMGPVKDWDSMIRQINQNTIFSLTLCWATDSDLKHLTALMR